MPLADKAREALRLASNLHAMCAGKSVNLRGMDNAASELRVLYPKWKWLPVVGVGFHLYVPYDDYPRIPAGVRHQASRIEGWTNEGRAFVFKDRRPNQKQGEWLDKPTHPDFGILDKTAPTPTVWDRLGADDDFGR